MFPLAASRGLNWVRTRPAAFAAFDLSVKGGGHSRVAVF